MQLHLVERHLGWPLLAGILLFYFLVPSLIAVFLFDSLDVPDGYADVESVVRDRLAAAVASVVIVSIALSFLWWWRDAWHERLGTQSWVWIVPAAILVASIAFMDYSRISDAGIEVVAVLLLTTFFIGLHEELMFRGLVLKTLRDRYPETRAVILMCLLFGLAHLLGGGPLQALVTIPAGFIYYLCKRVSGNLALAVLVHGLWDFSIFSNNLTADPAESASGPVILLLVELGLVGLLLLRRKSIASSEAMA